MPRVYIPALLILLLMTASLLVGCGGGGAVSSPPVDLQSQQVFVVDFVHNTVSVAVRPQYVDNAPGPAGAKLRLVLTVGLNDPSNPGARLLQATVTNNLPGFAGGLPGGPGSTSAGAITGLDLCLVKTVFRNAAAAAVAGGGYALSDSLDPLTGTPVYSIPYRIEAGSISPAKGIDILLPATATTAEITIFVRAHLQRAMPPSLSLWYLSTIAGLTASPGYIDGPLGSAQFAGPQSLLYRDEEGDLLVADPGNNRVRTVNRTYVGSFAGDGTAASCNLPVDVALDADRNVVICEYGAHCISLAQWSLYSGLPVIVGLRGTPGDVPAVGATTTGTLARFNLPESLAVVGNVTYVADAGNHKLKTVTYDGAGSRTASASYLVTSAAVSFAGDFFLTADGRGALYALDNAGRKVFRRAPGGTAWALIAGTGTNATKDGTGATAQFKDPTGIAADSAGVLYVTEYGGALRRLWQVGTNATLPANWQVTTLVPAGAAADGGPGPGKVFALNGRPGISRDGVIYLINGHSIRRLDRTRS